jgi:ankyrin repeat protein
MACQLGHLEIVRLLLSHGTEHELQPPDSFSWYREKHLTPASLAIYAGHEDIVDELARVEPRVLTSAGSLALAALRPDRAMVKKCLAAGATPRTGYDVQGIVPLHAAIVGGDLDIVAEFLNLGGHAGCVDEATTTEVKKKGSDSLVLSDTHFAWPLELAVNASPKASVDLVRLLLEYGAYEGKRYVIREDFLETRFNFMVQSCIRVDDIACLEVLLQFSRLKTSAKFVGYARSPEMLQLLLRYGSDLDLLEDERGDRPVHIMAKKLVASRNKDATMAAVEAFIMLIKKNRDVNTRDFNGCTVLHICAEGMDEISYKYLCPTIEQKCVYEKRISLYVKTLLDLGARALISSALGRMALHGAIHGKHWKAARLLVQAGPKAVNMRNEWGETPLHALFGRYILLPRGLRRGRRARTACTGQILDI